MNTALRPNRSYWRLGWICLCGFSAIQLLTVFGGFEAPPEQRWIFWSIFPVFWMIWQVYCIWMLLTYLRKRLVLNADLVSWHGIWQSRSLTLTDVIECCWRLQPVGGGSTILRSSSDRIVIDWRDFDLSESEPVMRRLRQSIPVDKHRGWARFAYQRLVPLEFEFREQPDVLVELNRRTWTRIFLPGLVLSILVGIVVTSATGELRFLISPLPVACFWAILALPTPKEGFKMVRLSKQQSDKHFILWILFAVTVATIGPTILVAMRVWPQSPPGAILLYALWIVGGISLVAAITIRAQGKLHHRIEEQARRIVPDWERDWLKNKAS